MTIDISTDAIAAAANTDVLCDIYEAWIKANPEIEALEPQSADELLAEIGYMPTTEANKAHIKWLMAFIDRWEAKENEHAV